MYKCTIVQLACFLLNINKICRKNPVYNSVSPCTIQPAPPLLTPPFRAKKPTCRAFKTAIFRNTSPKKAEKSPSPHRRPLDTSPTRVGILASVCIQGIRGLCLSWLDEGGYSKKMPQ